MSLCVSWHPAYPQTEVEREERARKRERDEKERKMEMREREVWALSNERQWRILGLFVT